MIYIYSWLLYVKNDKFKHTTTSQRLAFNYFILTFSFSLSIFKLSHTKKHQVYNLCYFEFLLRNLLHSVRNMNLVTFLIGLFLLLFPIRNANDKVKDKDTFDVVLDISNFEHISLLVTVFSIVNFSSVSIVLSVNCWLRLLFVGLTFCVCWNQFRQSFHLWKLCLNAWKHLRKSGVFSKLDVS